MKGCIVSTHHDGRCRARRPQPRAGAFLDRHQLLLHQEVVDVTRPVLADRLLEGELGLDLAMDVLEDVVDQGDEEVAAPLCRHLAR